MTRDEIINLIREQYDPAPRDWSWRNASGWDDGAEITLQGWREHTRRRQFQLSRIQDHQGWDDGAERIADAILDGLNVEKKKE